MEQAPKFPYPFIDKIIVSEEDIKNRVEALGRQIASDYQAIQKTCCSSACCAEASSLSPT